MVISVNLHPFIFAPVGVASNTHFGTPIYTYLFCINSECLATFQIATLCMALHFFTKKKTPISIHYTQLIRLIIEIAVSFENYTF